MCVFCERQDYIKQTLTEGTVWLDTHNNTICLSPTITNDERYAVTLTFSELKEIVSKLDNTAT